jgi:hypothetical protein
MLRISEDVKKRGLMSMEDNEETIEKKWKTLPKLSEQGRQKFFFEKYGPKLGKKGFLFF